MNTIVVRLRNVILTIAAMLMMGTGAHAGANAASPSPREPAASDKCPVCGMFVKEYPRWWSEIIDNGDKVTFFDGPKDLFKYLLKPELYGGKKSEKVSAIYVREYYSLRWIDARDGFYVIDSDVYGPMGHDLVPLATREDAEEFKHDHRGSKIVRFNEVDWQILMRLSQGEEM